MARFYKELNNEELAQEIEKLEAVLKLDFHHPSENQGFEEVLNIYKRELELREKLPQ